VIAVGPSEYNGTRKGFDKQQQQRTMHHSMLLRWNREESKFEGSEDVKPIHYLTAEDIMHLTQGTLRPRKDQVQGLR
jgi:hypothetical protein